MLFCGGAWFASLVAVIVILDGGAWFPSFDGDAPFWKHFIVYLAAFIYPLGLGGHFRIQCSDVLSLSEDVSFPSTAEVLLSCIASVSAAAVGRSTTHFIVLTRRIGFQKAWCVRTIVSLIAVLATLFVIPTVTVGRVPVEYYDISTHSVHTLMAMHFVYGAACSFFGSRPMSSPSRFFVEALKLICGGAVYVVLLGALAQSFTWWSEPAARPSLIAAAMFTTRFVVVCTSLRRMLFASHSNVCGCFRLAVIDAVCIIAACYCYGAESGLDGGGSLDGAFEGEARYPSKWDSSAAGDGTSGWRKSLVAAVETVSTRLSSTHWMQSPVFYGGIFLVLLMFNANKATFQSRRWLITFRQDVHMTVAVSIAFCWHSLIAAFVWRELVPRPPLFILALPLLFFLVLEQPKPWLDFVAEGERQSASGKISEWRLCAAVLSCGWTYVLKRKFKTLFEPPAPRSCTRILPHRCSRAIVQWGAAATCLAFALWILPALFFAAVPRSNALSIFLEYGSWMDIRTVIHVALCSWYVHLAYIQVAYESRTWKSFVPEACILTFIWTVCVYLVHAALGGAFNVPAHGWWIYENSAPTKAFTFISSCARGVATFLKIVLKAEIFLQVADCFSPLTCFSVWPGAHAMDITPVFEKLNIVPWLAWIQKQVWYGSSQWTIAPFVICSWLVVWLLEYSLAVWRGEEVWRNDADGNSFSTVVTAVRWQ